MHALVALPIALILALFGCKRPEPGSGPIALLNVSYDPTREFYADVNRAFAARWLAETGEVVTIKQAHGGSGAQARAVADGLEADVLTLALSHDVDTVQRRGLLSEDWRERFPNDSSPFSSRIVLLVRAGNPKNIRDWDDLVRDGVSVVTPNPKTGGGARVNYLAAWSYALETFGRDETKAREFVTRLYENVPVLDSGARGSTTTFVERGIGDALISWENEARLAVRRLQARGFEIVVPSVTILARLPVAVVDEYAEKHGTTKIARAYLEFLFSAEGQELAAKYDFLPSNAPPKTGPGEPRLVTIEELGGWDALQAKHFADGGLFDRMYTRR